VDPRPAYDGLRWSPRTSLREGLVSTLEWARGH
jgi:UDP-glucose 4-epimerase